MALKVSGLLYSLFNALYLFRTKLFLQKKWVIVANNNKNHYQVVIIWTKEFTNYGLSNDKPSSHLIGSCIGIVFLESYFAPKT